MRAESRSEAGGSSSPANIPEPEGGAQGDTVHLAAGRSYVPEPLLEPVFENDRRHFMHDLAAFLLDRHLRRLAAMRNPLERRLARLLARLQKNSGYLELGFARLSDYVTERLGISVRRMQMLLQMDERLRDLPLTSAAFVRGSISSSQVRLLLRVATPETEAAWLEKAARLNVRLLEREVAGAVVAPAAGGEPAQQAGGPAQAAGASGELPGVDRAQVTDGPAQTSRVLPDDEEEPGRPVSFACPDRIRTQWEWAVEICRRASGATEPLWRCAEYIAADFLSGVPDLAARLAGACGDQDDTPGPALSPDGECPGGARPRDDDPDTDLFEEVLRGYEEEYGPRGWAPGAEGLEVVLPDSVRDDPEDGARDLDRRLRALVRLRQGLAWQQGRLLATFSTLGLHRALGFLSFGRYCRERAGLGIRRARQLIALDRRLVELPDLSQAYREGDVSWVKASAVARVADESSEQSWIQLARSVTFRRLREETALAAARIENDPPEGSWMLRPWRTGRVSHPDGLDSSGEVQVDSPWRLGRTTWAAGDAGVQTCAPPTAGNEVQTCAGDATQVGVQTCAPAAAGDGVQMCASSWSRVRFWAPDDVAALWQHALNVCRLTEGRPLADWECVARMIASFLHTWDVSGDPKWRRDHRIFERDGWRCRVPGCSSRRSLQVHHVIYRSRGGGNEDDNLAVLCATHHLQGIHTGRLRCRGSCEGHLRWEFGSGHGGAPIMTTVEEVLLGAVADRFALAPDARA